MPWELRKSCLARENIGFFMRHYKPGPMRAVQREFH